MTQLAIVLGHGSSNKQFSQSQIVIIPLIISPLKFGKLPAAINGAQPANENLGLGIAMLMQPHTVWRHLLQKAGVLAEKPLKLKPGTPLPPPPPPTPPPPHPAEHCGQFISVMASSGRYTRFFIKTGIL